MYDIDTQCETAREFVDVFLDPNLFEPESILDVSDKFVSGYLFRGQSNKDWRLIPTAHRSEEALKDYTPQPPHKRDDTNVYLATQIHAELRAVQLFLEAADQMGIGTPIEYITIHGHQTLMDNLLRGEVDSAKLDFPEQEYLASMALAQHHGVPTRLLDWTASPFIAAYFAASGVSSLDEKDREGGYFSVICLGTQLLSKVKSLKIVSAPKAQNSFLRAQEGAFTIVKNANKYYLDNNCWPSIEDIVDLERDKRTYYMRDPLIRISLPNSEADNLLRLLYRLGVSKLSVMPSLDNAANNLKYKRKLWPKVK